MGEKGRVTNSYTDLGVTFPLTQITELYTHSPCTDTKTQKDDMTEK